LLCTGSEPSTSHRLVEAAFGEEVVFAPLYNVLVDIPAYLQRINYRGPLSATSATLRELHIAHLLTVPFENLSIHYGESIVLDEEVLFEKIVRCRRGGFCYELNGLFAALLRSLGFEVALLSANVANSEGSFSPDFDHMALLITLRERWLADVGFGDCFIEPLRLDDPVEQIQGRQAYRIEITDSQCTLLRCDDDKPWRPQYRFGLASHSIADYAPRCRFHQTSPESHFKQSRICSRATPEGRVTLSDLRFITTRDGGRQEKELANEKEFVEALREHFGIALHDPR
jgi:N-hydroxyarylamine O-acetyltransferase